MNTKIKTNKSKSKNIRIEPNFLNQLEILCELKNTNFSSKTKELLTKWQIDELAFLKEKAPELFQAYQDKIKAKK